MRKVIGVGETVLDIVFKHEQPMGALPGGSVFNTIVSLGRVGADATFISAVGNDRVGANVISFLKDNGVHADYVTKYAEGQTPISLAFLNEQNDADYLFYHDNKQHSPDFTYPDVQPDDIVIFGSFYAVSAATRPQVVSFLEFAHSRGAIIYYDVNFRPSHQNEVMKITPNLIENLEYADIVRGSHEDFKVLYKQDNPDKVYKSEISFYCRKLIYTCGAAPVELRADGGLAKSYPIAPTSTISTIGAGDNFNAGFIYGMLKYGITREHIERGLTEEQWDCIIGCAQEFAADCCGSIYNYVSKDFGNSKRL